MQHIYSLNGEDEPYRYLAYDCHDHEKMQGWVIKREKVILHNASNKMLKRKGVFQFNWEAEFHASGTTARIGGGTARVFIVRTSQSTVVFFLHESHAPGTSWYRSRYRTRPPNAGNRGTISGTRPSLSASAVPAGTAGGTVGGTAHAPRTQFSAVPATVPAPVLLQQCVCQGAAVLPLIPVVLPLPGNLYSIQRVSPHLLRTQYRGY